MRNLSLPSPSASSTSSSHSSNSFSSYGSSGKTSTINGQTRRRKQPSPLTTPSSLLYNTIPEELPDWAKPTDQEAIQVEQNHLLGQRPQYLDLSSIHLATDPNQRLQDKIRQHVIANKDFKLKQNTADNASEEIVNQNAQNRARTHLVHQRVAQASTTKPFKSMARFNPQPDTSSPFHTSSVSTSQADRSADQYKSTVIHTPLRKPQEMNSYNQPISSEVSTSSSPSSSQTQHIQPLKENLDNHVHITPRAAPIDLAVPLPNTKRSHSRRRVPLSDMIMQKKIAESLRKSLTIGARQPSPEVTEASSGLSMSPGGSLDLPGRASTSIHVARMARTRSPSPPSHYMKAWQASEVAQSSDTDAHSNLAIPQAPVQSQQLPPRQVARVIDIPPGRPPKLNSLHITKI